MSGYPLLRENREIGQKEFPVRENTGNLEILQKYGIWFALVVNSLILNLFLKVDNLPSQFCLCNSHKSRKWHRENVQLYRENTGNLKINLSGYPGMCVCVCVCVLLYR